MGNKTLLMGYKEIVENFIKFISYIGKFDSFYYKIRLDIFEKTTVKQDEEIMLLHNTYMESIIKELAEQIDPQLTEILPQYFKNPMSKMEKDYETIKRRYRDYFELDYEEQSCDSNEYWRDRIQHDWSDQDTD